MSFSFHNVQRLAKNTMPMEKSIIFAYLPKCPYSINESKTFGSFAKLYKGPLKLYSVNVDQYPIKMVEAVPVIIAYKDINNVQLQNVDNSIEDQLSAAQNFLLNE